MNHDKWMRMAIDKAREGVAAGQTPFGAAIVKAGRLVCCEHNVVLATCDITAHAEVHAIRTACRKLAGIDLSGAVIYSTCEPCPMCFAACHWARLSAIHYGAAIADARRAGFNELGISNEVMKREGGSPIEVRGGLMAEECARLFDEWIAKADRRGY